MSLSELRLPPPRSCSLTDLFLLLLLLLFPTSSSSFFFPPPPTRATGWRVMVIASLQARKQPAQPANLTYIGTFYTFKPTTSTIQQQQQHHYYRTSSQPPGKPLCGLRVPTFLYRVGTRFAFTRRSIEPHPPPPLPLFFSRNPVSDASHD